MESWTPYLDTQFCYDHPGAIAQAGIFDDSARRVMGSAIGHYRARTVRPHLQYFDCDLRFPEPLRIHKVLPGGLCLVQVLDGGWEHRVDGRLHHYRPGPAQVLGLDQAVEALDQLPAGSHARMAGLRVAADYLHRLADEDPGLQPLLELLQAGGRFTELPRGGALGALLQRLYQSPYQGVMERLHQESLSLAVLVELATLYRGGPARERQPVRGQRDLAHEARRLLDANLVEPPGSQALARQLGVGETTLRRSFVQVFGLSMLQYLRQQRMELARNLLRQRKWQVAQIAYRLGYANPANFNHAYKAYFGHPPGTE